MARTMRRDRESAVRGGSLSCLARADIVTMGLDSTVRVAGLRVQASRPHYGPWSRATEAGR